MSKRKNQRAKREWRRERFLRKQRQVMDETAARCEDWARVAYDRLWQTIKFDADALDSDHWTAYYGDCHEHGLGAALDLLEARIVMTF